MVIFLLLLTAGFIIPDGAVAFTLQVVDESGSPVNGFRYLVEEDTTHPVTPGQFDPNMLSMGIHRSYAPVVKTGTSSTSVATVNITPTKRYYVSVLPNSGYTLSGASLATGQTQVTVTVNKHPVLTAQMSVHVFHDNHPINNARMSQKRALPISTSCCLTSSGRCQLMSSGTRSALRTSRTLTAVFSSMQTASRSWL